jgi:acetyl esterase/lipase
MRVHVASDSAGGHLAFMTALSIPAAGWPKPAGVVAISPLTDIGPDRAVCRKERGCSVFPPRRRRCSPATSPERSRGSRWTASRDRWRLRSQKTVAKLPPVMIHAGADELRGDAELVTDRLLASGVPCDLHIWQGQG